MMRLSRALGLKAAANENAPGLGILYFSSLLVLVSYWRLQGRSLVRSSNNYTAGTHALTASSAVERLGYLIGGYTQGTLTVNRKNVTASYTASSKTYDTTNFATVTGSLTGVVSGDSVSVSKTSSVFSDANVADGKTVSVSGISIGATDASNYTLQNTTTTTTANISEAVLQIIANAEKYCEAKLRN